MRKCLFFVLLLSCLSTACGYKHAPKPETVVQKDIVDRELVRSRAEILSQLSDLQAVSSPRPPMLPASTVAPYDLSYPARLYWEGPIEQGLASLGTNIGWQARRYGPSPTQDIIVFCDPTDTGFEVVQKFQAQAGNRARITIDEANRVLKLVYGSDIAPQYRRRSGARRHERPQARPHRKPAAALPRVPSSYKPTLPVKEESAAPKPPAPVPPEKTTSDLVTNTQPHQNGSAAMIDQVLGGK